MKTAEHSLKTFKYTWAGEIFLLHIQLDSPRAAKYPITIVRNYGEKGTGREVMQIPALEESHRFMVSRTHPKEVGFVIEYPSEITLEAYKLDDRAYYPTESFFRG